MAETTLTFRRQVRAPADQVYRALTNGMLLRRWCCDAAVVDARVGGALYFGWSGGYHAAGEFTTLEPDRKVGFTWMGRGNPAPTQVDVALTPDNGETTVELVHSGFGAGWEWNAARDQCNWGWDNGLTNLQSVLETGEDIRFVKRPMLGIMVDDFNADIAARIGVPVTQGIHLSSLVEGMGAATAGLMGGDVIVEVDGRPTPDWSSLRDAISPHLSGDKVSVGYYRGSERRSTDMTLSARPLPAIPSTPRALAEVSNRIVQSALAGVIAAVGDATDAEASKKPAPGEWSALEVMGHLMIGERDNQAFIADLVNQAERFADPTSLGTNVHARVTAAVRAYPTVAAMVTALRGAAHETEAFLAELPDSFASNKAIFWELAHNQLQSAAEHWGEHSDQIRAAIEAARR